MVHSGQVDLYSFQSGWARGGAIGLARLMEEVETQTARIEREENTELLEIIKLFY